MYNCYSLHDCLNVISVYEVHKVYLHENSGNILSHKRSNRCKYEENVEEEKIIN